MTNRLSATDATTDLDPLSKWLEAHGIFRWFIPQESEIELSLIGGDEMLMTMSVMRVVTSVEVAELMAVLQSVPDGRNAVTVTRDIE